MAITDKKISTIYNGRDISSLSDRPNQDGMTATQLKARFDQLGKEIIPKINDLIDELFADMYSGATQTGHTHNLDNIVDGITYKLFTAVERAKLALIEENAEVNQNAFSNVKVNSTTLSSTSKTDTFELVQGVNIVMTVDSLTKKITLNAVGDIATQAVQSLLEDIGNYFTSLNVEGALQEVGEKLNPSVSKTTPVDADTFLISDSADSNIFKKLTWANIKATLKAYLDTIYAAITHAHDDRYYTEAEVNATFAPKANPAFTGTQTLPNIVTNGVKFPATQVPSSDPNTLDDYEEGTWTPTLYASSVAGNHTYSVRYGSYVKIGKMVYIKAKIVLSELDSSWNGGVSISGLPFVAQNDAPYGAINLWHSTGITYPSGRTYLDALVSPNSAVVSLYAHGSNIAHTILQHTDFTGVGEITIGGCYIANN